MAFLAAKNVVLKNRASTKTKSFEEALKDSKLVNYLKKETSFRPQIEFEA